MSHLRARSAGQEQFDRTSVRIAIAMLMDDAKHYLRFPGANVEWKPTTGFEYRFFLASWSIRPCNSCRS